jgi:RNA polymerase sigma factor (sigma-70 family)
MALPVRASSTASPVAEQRAFEDRIAPIAPDLLRYFARRVVPTDDSYDCLSETLIVLWRRRNSLPLPAEELRAWSFGVARRVLANHWRAQKRHGALMNRIADRDEQHGDPDILIALDSLATQDRELVRLIVWDGFGVAEAGALLGMRAGAARSRYSRARARLREHLEREADNEHSIHSVSAINKL